VSSAAKDRHYHLTVEVVLEVHAEAIGRFGGSVGIREMALLESAVAAPQASFGGEPAYTKLAEVAAAYLFFICRNHPFVDGNKRVALGTCIVFLRLNGVEPMPDTQAWEDLTLDVAASKLSRERTTGRLEALLPA
jgi:death-on-curing protein